MSHEVVRLVRKLLSEEAACAGAPASTPLAAVGQVSLARAPGELAPRPQGRVGIQVPRRGLEAVAARRRRDEGGAVVQPAAASLGVAVPGGEPPQPGPQGLQSLPRFVGGWVRVLPLPATSPKGLAGLGPRPPAGMRARGAGAATLDFEVAVAAELRPAVAVMLGCTPDCRQRRVRAFFPAVTSAGRTVARVALVTLRVARPRDALRGPPLSA